uniref:Uncharacterized protein n=1 Tax=Rhizophora mucronata TaxID=61149 RepID=A0A2P2LC80_RHIMU
MGIELSPHFHTTLLGTWLAYILLGIIIENETKSGLAGFPLWLVFMVHI